MQKILFKIIANNFPKDKFTDSRKLGTIKQNKRKPLSDMSYAHYKWKIKKIKTLQRAFPHKKHITYMGITIQITENFS